MKLRRLNQNGMTYFDRFRESYTDQSDVSGMQNELSSSTNSVEVSSLIDVDPKCFPTRFEVGQYLNDLF